MKKIDTFSHYRDGKSQMQRFLTELDPSNLELHDFDLFDWLLFANNFANHVNYFDKRILNIKFRDKFKFRRGRINCSLNDNGVWRWFGIQFSIEQN